MLTVDELVQYNTMEKLKERMGRVIDYIETLKQYLGQSIPQEWMGDDDYPQNESELEAYLRDVEEELSRYEQAITKKEHQESNL